MKLRYLKHTGILLLLLQFASCKKENMGDCFKSTGDIVTEIRDLPQFERLEVEDNVNVYLRFGDEFKVELEAGENLLDLIETEVEGNTLYIRNKNTCNWVRSFKVPVNITLYCSEISELVARGYGEIVTLDTLRTSIFLADQWMASGMVSLIVDADEVYLKSHTGPGDFTCSGNVDFLYSYNSSFGIHRLENTIARKGYVWNAGTGDIHVYVTDSLTMQIERHGDVYYSGSPSFVEQFITGEGNAIPVSE